AGLEDDEALALLPALRQAVALQEDMLGLRGAARGGVVHVAERFRVGRLVEKSEIRWNDRCGHGGIIVAPMNKPAELKLQSVPAWIDGKAVSPAGRSGEVYNPATGQVTKRVPFCDASVIDAAVKSAAAAFPAWRDTPPLRRARVMQDFLHLLKKHQKDLAAIVTAEHGKTLPDAMGSVQRGIEVVEFAC